MLLWVWGFNFQNCLVRRMLFSLSTLHCSGEVKLAQVSVACCTLSQSPTPPPWANGNTLYCGTEECDCRFHICKWLLPGEEKRLHFLLLHKLVGPETGKKKITAISVALYSNPISFCSISRVPILSRCVCFCLCLWEGGRMWGIVSELSCAFQLVGRCGLQGADWAGPCPAE